MLWKWPSLSWVLQVLCAFVLDTSTIIHISARTFLRNMQEANLHIAVCRELASVFHHLYGGVGGTLIFQGTSVAVPIPTDCDVTLDHCIISGGISLRSGSNWSHGSHCILENKSFWWLASHFAVEPTAIFQIGAITSGQSFLKKLAFLQTICYRLPFFGARYSHAKDS